VAIAATGRDVELRGDIDMALLKELSTPVGASPIINLPARPATSDDLVIIPDGDCHILRFAIAALSPAQCIIFMLGPPGIVGWSFDPEWCAVDPLTVPPSEVGTERQFKAMAACGFMLWTNSAGLAAAAHVSGTACVDIGVGWPSTPHPTQKREFDVVALEHNRWAPLAHQILDDLPVTTHWIPNVPHKQLQEELGRGKILAWPSRIEGWARIQCEARIMSTVPVALNTNRFAVGLTPACGAVTADSVEKIGLIIEQLLADPNRLNTLSERAQRSAQEQVDWASYVMRVDSALRAITIRDEGTAARSTMGASVQHWAAAIDIRRIRAEEKIEQTVKEIEQTVHAMSLLHSRSVNPISMRDFAFAAWRTSLPQALKRMMQNRFPKLKQKRFVLIGPRDLDDPLYAMRQLLDRLGANVHTEAQPEQVYDLVLGWYDSNVVRTPGITTRPTEIKLALSAMVRNTKARHYWNCAPKIDVSKHALERAFESVFGRALKVDPATFEGKAIEKSDENASHDGVIVQCPMQPTPGKTYERVIEDGSDPIQQWRVCVMGGTPVCVNASSNAMTNRFNPQSEKGQILPIEEVLTPQETIQTTALCKELQMDYCDLDMLRDREEKMWIINANPTPTFSSQGFPDPQKLEGALQRLAELLDAQLC